ncbi:HipA N-terminal domain-containing protein [Pigmentiphaga litoralis]|uniref:HipA N-terminal domain-containing protein n=1 Tax=Pigmentiphaga litoralis TaxID=516702 RepID=UPI003B433654
MMASLQAADSRFLWYLGLPSAPLPVGELRLLVQSRGVSLRYADSWLKQGFPLSEDLPLIDIEHLPIEKEKAAGAVDDARPDRWGERVIRLLDKPPRLALLDYLFFAGDDRFGALGVSSSATAYQPHHHGALPTLADVDRLHQLTQQILKGEAVEELGEDGASSTLDNAASGSKAYGLTTAQAKAEMARVARAVDAWQSHFAAAGIPAAVIEGYAAQIDRPFLLNQRRRALQHG